MKDDIHINDDANEAAKKVSEDLKKEGWYINKDGNGKDKDKKHPHYVQKYTEPGLLAESIIVGGIPYFAVTRARAAAITESVIYSNFMSCILSASGDSKKTLSPLP
jgi:hypothetical protein